MSCSFDANHDFIKKEFGEVFKKSDRVSTSQTKIASDTSTNVKQEVKNEVPSQSIDVRSATGDPYCDQKRKIRTVDTIKLERDQEHVNDQGATTASSLLQSTASCTRLKDGTAVHHQYKCTVCSQTYRHCKDLNIHLSINHIYDLPYTCVVCPAMFSDKASLISHARKHLCESSYSCTECSASFGERDGLKSHSQIHVGSSVDHGAVLMTGMFFKCPFCPGKFTLKFRLLQHIYAHTDEQPFTCTLCPASFTMDSSLKCHLRAHSGEKPYHCSMCPAKFARASYLRSHAVTHSGEKPYSCSVCHVKFSSSSNLRSHVRRNSGEKPYYCSLCYVKFTTSSSVTSHICRRRSSKPFNRAFGFSKSGNPKCDIRTNTGQKPYGCTYCMSKFSSPRQLSLHIRTNACY